MQKKIEIIINNLPEKPPDGCYPVQLVSIHIVGNIGEGHEKERNNISQCEIREGSFSLLTGSTPTKRGQSKESQPHD